MKSYTFCLATGPTSIGYNVPREQWEKHFIDVEWSGVIRVTLNTEAWDDPPDSNPIYECADILLESFFQWMKTAYCHHGYLLAPQRYSPRQLFEALESGWKHQWKVEGDVPENPYLPSDRDLEDNGYGDLVPSHMEGKGV